MAGALLRGPSIPVLCTFATHSPAAHGLDYVPQVSPSLDQTRPHVFVPCAYIQTQNVGPVSSRQGGMQEVFEMPTLILEF